MSFECYIILRGFEEAYSNDSHDLPTIYQKNMLKKLLRWQKLKTAK